MATMMSFNNSSSHDQLLLCTPTLLLITLLLFHLFLLSPVSSFRHPSSTQGLLFEEKARLGSRPPSCHNKCNQCHPCMAVQVPTLPSNNGIKPEASASVAVTSEIKPTEYFDYKPLGWKCRCGNHFYNP